VGSAGGPQLLTCMKPCKGGGSPLPRPATDNFDPEICCHNARWLFQIAQRLTGPTNNPLPILVVLSRLFFYFQCGFISIFAFFHHCMEVDRHHLIGAERREAEQTCRSWPRRSSVWRQRKRLPICKVLLALVLVFALPRWQRKPVPGYVDHEFGVGFALSLPYVYVRANSLLTLS
jgi:hypothetical protein